MHDIPDGGKWLGAPAQPDRQAKRQMIAIQQLPDLIRRVNELERQIAGATGSIAVIPKPASSKTIKLANDRSPRYDAWAQKRVWFNGRMWASQA